MPEAESLSVIRVNVWEPGGFQQIWDPVSGSKAPSLPSWRSRDLPGGRQADCSKGVAIQPSAVRRNRACSSKVAICSALFRLPQS
jgi:hypothetical protein